MLDIQRVLGGHLPLVPLAVDLGLGNPILDPKSRTVPLYTRVTEVLTTIGPRVLFSGKRDSHESQDEAAIQLHLSPFPHCCD